MEVQRLLEISDKLDLPLTANINTSVYDFCPQVFEAFRKRGDEFVCHGQTNSKRQAELNEVEKATLAGCKNYAA